MEQENIVIQEKEQEPRAENESREVLVFKHQNENEPSIKPSITESERFIKFLNSKFCLIP